MNTKSRLKLKKKPLKNKKENDIKECQCIWIFLPNLQKTTELKSIIIDTEITSPKMEDQNTTITDTESPTPENHEETLNEKSAIRKLRNSRLVRLPRIGCTIPFLTKLINKLCNSGVTSMDEGQMTQAINIIAKAKKDLDDGGIWNRNIDICENIKLKLYSSGLVLHYKM